MTRAYVYRNENTDDEVTSPTRLPRLDYLPNWHLVEEPPDPEPGQEQGDGDQGQAGDGGQGEGEGQAPAPEPTPEPEDPAGDAGEPDQEAADRHDGTPSTSKRRGGKARKGGDDADV